MEDILIRDSDIIDCDIKPFEPSGLMVAPESQQLPNRLRGKFIFDPARIGLYFSEDQRNDRIIGSNKLYKELASQLVLPAHMLDFYLDHPHLAPREWKTGAVLFWGTMYCDLRGNLFVRCLFWWQGLYWGQEGRWRSNYGCLSDNSGGSNPAAVLIN